MIRWCLNFIVWVNHKMKRASIKLVKWTGKHPEYVHPKHLLGEDPDQYWYLSLIQAEDILLDVGCGSGMHAIRAARVCRSVIGFDHNPESLGIGERTAHTQGLCNVTFRAGNAEESFPFQDGQFTKVMMLDVLEHLRQRDRVLEEARRVLKPGGFLLLAVPNRMTTWRRRLAAAGLFSYSDPDHKFEYTRDEIHSQLLSRGFEIIREGPVVVDTPWVGAIDLVGGISLGLYRRLHEWKKDYARRCPEESIGFQIVGRRREPQ
ncbi:MAG: class I SAM-dependent methyltransferase [Elusimicrobia bacterium]|nr:class I SAM-dependent methyltransferase [Elusimicrobiota bacterium]